jgi:hypothetical protein
MLKKKAFSGGSKASIDYVILLDWNYQLNIYINNKI